MDHDVGLKLEELCRKRLKGHHGERIEDLPHRVR
jgi:hypothetical protein